MKSLAPSRSLRQAALWGALLTTLAGLIVWRLSELKVEVAGLTMPGLANLSYDALFLARPALAITNVVIVSMDEASHQHLGQAPDQLWDRARHAELLDSLRACGARAVVFDILFADAGPDPQVDTRLSQALQRAAGKVVLAAKLQTFELNERAGGSRGELQPIPAFAAVAPFGVVDLPKDPDGALRRHPAYPHQTPLAWKVAEIVDAPVVASNRERWINYYSPREAVRHISYWQALRPETLAPDVFSNQVVFVGRSGLISPRGANLGDDYPTPYSRWTGHLLSGVEVQATVFLNLWRRDWIEKLSGPIQALLFVTFGALFGFGLGLARPLPALGWAAGGALLIAVGTIGLFSAQRLWFPWLIVVVVQIPLALCWSVLGFVQRAAENRGIPDHELLRCVGRGAYGEVWLARNAVGGFHAVKILYRKNFPTAEPFEREFVGIQNFAPLSRSHPGLVHILHVGRKNLGNSFFYYIMEAADDAHAAARIDPARYEPRTLAREIARRGRLPPRDCVQLALQLTSALDFLHRRNLVHRDIKPANIIFVQGQSKLADAGLVTTLGGSLTRIGTSGYLAPEGPGAASADLFALGKTLYEAVTGCECGRFPELPSDLTPGADADTLLRLHEILLTACENNVADRYPSAAAMHAQLLELQAACAAPPARTA